MRNSKNAAISLHSLNGIVQVSSFIYINALFLSSYPATWLPYFFIGQTFFDITISYFLASLFAKNSRIYNTSILFVMAVLASILSYSAKFHFYYQPLVFSFFLMSCGLLTNILCWNVVRTSFDVMEFKSLTASITIARSAIDIVTSIVIGLLIKKFNIVFLPVLISVTFALASICIYRLNKITQLTISSNENTRPLKYPLYQKVFITIFVTAISYTFIDYCLKYELSIHFSAEKIGEFMAIFNGVCSGASLLFSLFGIKLLSNKLGTSSLLFTLPIYWIMTAAVAAVFPRLGAVVIMAAGKYIFYYGIFSAGRELLLNVLPHTILVAGQFLIKSIATPVASGIASIFLFFFARDLSIQTIICIVLCLNLFIVVFIREMHGHYVATLKKAISLKRFNMLDQANSKESIGTMAESVHQSLVSEDPEKILWGFTLLPQLKLQEFPQAILQHVGSHDAAIRLHVVKTIAYYRTKEMTSCLLERIEKETDPEIKWWLFDTLSDLNPKTLLKLGRTLLQDPVPEIRAGAIRIILTAGNLDDEIHALASLLGMLADPSMQMRRNGARILCHVNIGNMNEELCSLIEDEDNIVSTYAINAAAQMKKSELAPIVIQRVLKGGVFHAAKKYLRDLDMAIAPLLIERIQVAKNSLRVNMTPLIMLLASVTSSEIENSMLNLIDETNVPLKNIVIKELAIRVQLLPLLETNKNLANKLAKKDYLFLISLRLMQVKYQTYRGMMPELDISIYFAKQRLLYWAVIYASSSDIFRIIPSILSENKVEKAKALELVISIIKNHELAKIFMAVFADTPAHLPEDVSILAEDHLDPWIKKVFDSFTQQESENKMNNMQKVFVLRRVELFKQLPGEVLSILAEETNIVDISTDETIFSEGDAPTGLYIIVSGSVNIIKQDTIIANLKAYDFFGELALLDNSKRAAYAISASDCMLLFISAETFNRISEDLPEVLRAVVQVLLKYLRRNS